mmetsp:Transcript_57281/g.150867  ORF Transcript_57281/g.150867 Transcript_57281/m.150867 type:complete len:203 (-) Transcript_57281:755-1363(-)
MPSESAHTAHLTPSVLTTPSGHTTPAAPTAPSAHATPSVMHTVIRVQHTASYQHIPRSACARARRACDKRGRQAERTRARTQGKTEGNPCAQPAQPTQPIRGAGCGRYKKSSRDTILCHPHEQHPLAFFHSFFRQEMCAFPLINKGRPLSLVHSATPPAGPPGHGGAKLTLPTICAPSQAPPRPPWPRLHGVSTSQLPVHLR